MRSTDLVLLTEEGLFNGSHGTKVLLGTFCLVLGALLHARGEERPGLLVVALVLVGSVLGPTQLVGVVWPDLTGGSALVGRWMLWKSSSVRI